MLSREENELLTRTGQGTAMGSLMRRYWIPALLSEEIPETDCPPVRVRLLGEDLVAFRDTNGQVGLIAANCPHRGASLFFGRNEECGIRCVYHGWKFDVTGQCMDMPSEPAESNFKAKIKATAYPCEERAGVIWTYMGPPEHQPGLPDFGWVDVPETHRHVAKDRRECSWLQAVEGGIDSSHISFLHAPAPSRSGSEQGDFSLSRADKSPRFECVDTEYGLMVGARRDHPSGDQYYWRVSQWVMPWYNMIPPFGDDEIGTHMYVPVDDESCWAYHFAWRSREPFPADRLASMYEHDRATVDRKAWRPISNKENDYLIDRALQRTEDFTGIDQHIAGAEDRAMTESMGRIFDRTKEHLGTSDSGIVRARRRLLQAVHDLENGIDPPGVRPETHRIRAVSVVLSRDTSWVDAVRERMWVQPVVGAHPA